MTNEMTARQQTVAPALSSRVASALALFAFGAFFVAGVGLTNTSIAHNAAHDVRHAVGFPCH